MLVALGSCRRWHLLIATLLELIRDGRVLRQVTNTPLLGHPSISFVRMSYIGECLAFHLDTADWCWVEDTWCRVNSKILPVKPLRRVHQGRHAIATSTEQFLRLPQTHFRLIAALLFLNCCRDLRLAHSGTTNKLLFLKLHAKFA